MPEISIRRAGPEDAVQVAELVGTAFAPLKAVSWLLPEPSVRSRVMAADFLILVEHALKYGHVDVVDQGVGQGLAAAVWFDRTTEVPEPDDYDSRLEAACGVVTREADIGDAPHGASASVTLCSGPSAQSIRDPETGAAQERPE